MGEPMNVFIQQRTLSSGNDFFLIRALSIHAAVKTDLKMKTYFWTLVLILNNILRCLL